jgi:Zn-dependent M16 (insulinase) family peptidase
MKNEIRSSLAPLGNNYASCRAGRFSSPSTRTAEIWHGISQLEFARRLAELDTAQVAARLQSLREAIAAGGLIANITGSAEALKSGGTLIAQRFSRVGPPQKRTEGQGFAIDTFRQSAILTGNTPSPQTPDPIKEVFASPSLQVGFAAMTLRAAAYDTLTQTAETVLAHQLSTGALWEDIRMKGGAYGASASSDSLERCFSLSTYRDPNPLRSLDSFSTILKGGYSAKESGFQESGFQESLEKMIIGCYSRETRPRAPAEKGLADFLRFLSRIEDGYRRRRLERLIAISSGDISAALEELASQTAASQVIITGMKNAEQATKTLGAEIQVLPV